MVKHIANDVLDDLPAGTVYIHPAYPKSGSAKGSSIVFLSTAEGAFEYRMSPDYEERGSHVWPLAFVHGFVCIDDPTAKFSVAFHPSITFRNSENQAYINGAQPMMVPRPQGDHSQHHDDRVEAVIPCADGIMKTWDVRGESTRHPITLEACLVALSSHLQRQTPITQFYFRPKDKQTDLFDAAARILVTQGFAPSHANPKLFTAPSPITMQQVWSLLFNSDSFAALAQRSPSSLEMYPRYTGENAVLRPTG